MRITSERAKRAARHSGAAMTYVIICLPAKLYSRSKIYLVK